MTTKNGDLPAMPVKGNCVDASGAYCGDVVYSNGLTKREYFAALAMQGLLARHGDDDYQAEQIADYAVAHADALLKRLEKSK